MKKGIFLLIFLKGVLGVSQIQDSKLAPNGTAEINQNIHGIPTNVMYYKTLAWINKKQLITMKDKTYTIKNEIIIISGKARGIYQPVKGGIKSIYDVNYTLKISFFCGHYILSYKFGHFLKNNKELTTTPKDLFKKYNGQIKNMFKDFAFGIEEYINSTNKSLLNVLTKQPFNSTLVLEN